MNQQTGIAEAVAKFDNSPTKLAAAIGGPVLRQHIEHWLKAGRVPAERCAEVSSATGIPLERLNDKVNWSLVREVS